MRPDSAASWPAGSKGLSVPAACGPVIWRSSAVRRGIAAVSAAIRPRCDSVSARSCGCVRSSAICGSGCSSDEKAGRSTASACGVCIASRAAVAPAGAAILADLRMPGALEALDAILQGVDGGPLTAPEAIEQLLSPPAGRDALQSPAGREAAPRFRLHLSAVRREQIESLHELGFVERRENVIFLGPPGVAKTHLAISLASATAQSGRRVYYGTFADLITSLEEAQAAGRLHARLKILRALDGHACVDARGAVVSAADLG